MTNQMRSDGTRARILSAAVERFTHDGYDTTSVADICAAANVSKGAFYHHFPSKQAVFIALLERWLEELDEKIRSVAAGGESAPVRLSRLAGLVGQVSELGTGRVPMFLEFWRQAAKDPEVWQVTVEPYRRFRSAFASLIGDGIRERSLRAVDPDAAALALVSMGVGLVLQGALDPAEAQPADAGEDAVALLLEGLARGGDHDTE